MDFLYKYYAFNNHSEKNLSDGVIVFNNIMQFNDPFEGVGKFLYSVTAEEQAYWDSIGSDLPKHLADRMSNEVKDALIFKNRVFCATEKWNHPLMWAHYANSHTGFCVGYDKKELSKISSILKKVSYLTQPLPVDMTNLDKLPMNELLYYKSIAWAYEEEWRAIYSLNYHDVSHLAYQDNLIKCFQNDSSTDSFYMPLGHVQLNNLEVIQSKKIIIKKCKPQCIYFGLRTNAADKEKLSKIACNQGIEIYQTIQDINSYEISSVKLQ